EIDDVWWILNGLRETFSRNVNRTLYHAVQFRLWTWPTEKELGSHPKEWGGHNSPVRIDELTKDVSYYIEQPCPQHNIIDGAAINAILFTDLASSMDRYNTGEAYGQINWAYYLSKDNPLFALIDIQGARVVFPLLAWLDGTRPPDWRRLHDVLDNPILPFLHETA